MTKNSSKESKERRKVGWMRELVIIKKKREGVEE
jgi:hypothetical protein